jgi:hypothetical protein
VHSTPAGGIEHAQLEAAELKDFNFLLGQIFTRVAQAAVLGFYHQALNSQNPVRHFKHDFVQITHRRMFWLLLNLPALHSHD